MCSSDLVSAHAGACGARRQKRAYIFLIDAAYHHDFDVAEGSADRPEIRRSQTGRREQLDEIRCYGLRA